MEKIIKFRLFTWFESVDSIVHEGETVLAERIAHFGQTVDITNPAYVKRGEDLGAFFSDEEAKQIKAGTYRGHEAELLRRVATTGKITGDKVVEPLDDEHGDVSTMDSVELGTFIAENHLSIPATLALLPEDADVDTINRFLDAENIASDNDPRAGLVKALEAKLAEASQ